MTVSSGFWFLAGVMSAAAVLLLLGPSLQSLRLQSRWVIGGCAIGVLLAVALYLRLGSPELLGTTSSLAESSSHGAAAAASGSMTSSGQAAGSMDKVVTALEQRLKGGGGSDADWELLAKSYEFLGRADAAALARAHKVPEAVATPGSAATATAAATAAAAALATAAPPALTPAAEKLLAQAEAARQKRDFPAAAKLYANLAAQGTMTAQAWADFADVTASMNGNSLVGKPAEYIRRALQQDPAQAKALWLLASEQHETHQYVAAVETWRRLLAQMDAGSSDAKLIQANIDEDQRMAGGAPAANNASATAAAGLSVHGDVTLSAAMKSRVKSGQTLFIVAKSVNSPGMPVAVRRVETGAWPVSFELSDSDAMVPERKLSTIGAVTVEARISQSGLATSAPGDLLGKTAAFDPAAAGTLHLTIDSVVR